MHIECHLSIKHLAFIFVVLSLAFVYFVSAETTSYAASISEDGLISAEYDAERAPLSNLALSGCDHADVANGQSSGGNLTFYYSGYDGTKIFDAYAKGNCTPTAVFGRTPTTLSDVEVASIGLAVSVVLLAIATVCMVVGNLEQQKREGSRFI